MALYLIKPWYKKIEPATGIYGVEWDGSSNSSLIRTDDAIRFTNPNPYYNGMSGLPSSPFDRIMPWSGIHRITDASLGELVEYPKFYYKLSKSNNIGLKVQISMNQFDGSSVDPMHMDRGDGVGERDYAYIGRYHCSVNDYKSTSGVKPKVSITRAVARTNIHNLGSNVWQFDFAARFTLWLLYLVEFANWNSQAVIGHGGGSNKSASENCGASDNMPYHTGTMKTSRTTYGVGCQYRYIEDIWGNVFDYIDGCYYNSTGLNIIKNPSSFSDNSNGIFVSKPSAGLPIELSVKDIEGTFPIFMPLASKTSSYDLNTYICDLWNYNSSKAAIYMGANFNTSSGNARGLFFVDSITASQSATGLGCRLMVLPPSRLAS